MAWTSGTATDYRDLLHKLKQFVTTDMLPAGERWTALRWDEQPTTQELILKGPGLAGVDEIYVGIRSFENASEGWHFWDLQGFAGYNSANDFYTQPGAITTWPPGMALWNAPISYWFVANGRRIVVVAKVSTVYEAAYLGFIKPYALPNQYPYPLLIGGSATGERGRSYSITNPNHRHFVDPGEHSQNNANTACMLRNPAGVWKAFQNVYYSSGEPPYNSPRQVWPTIYNNLGIVREAPDGSYPLLPIVLTEYASSMDMNLFGELDGCYWVSGFNNAAENLISIGGVDHLVVQNVYRTTVRDYWALRLE